MLSYASITVATVAANVSLLIEGCLLMPIFEYRCQTCGHTFEHLARNRTDLPGACVKCGAAAPVKQLSTFSARADASASRACDSCPAPSACPTVGRGCCGGACHHSHA